MSQASDRKVYLVPLALGAASAALYGSMVLMPAFLVPIQASGARRGYRSLLASAAVSCALIAAWQVMLLGRSGSLDAASLAISLSVPLAMAGALALMGLPALGKVSFPVRALAGGALASAAALPSMAMAADDPGVRAVFEDAMAKTMGALGTAAPDAEQVWLAVQTGVASSFGAVIFLFIFVSAWIGTRLGQSRSAENAGLPDGEGSMALPPSLSAYRLPAPLVWGLLASWGAMLATRFFPSSLLLAASLNVAIALSICYGVQGLAVAGALAERVGMAPALRIVGPLALVLLLASGTAGLIAIGALALLGTLETWIPFRAATLKGDKP